MTDMGKTIFNYTSNTMTTHKTYKYEKCKPGSKHPHLPQGQTTDKIINKQPKCHKDENHNHSRIREN